MKTTLFAAVLIGFFALISCTKSDDLIPEGETSLSLLSVDAEGVSSMTRANVVPVLDATSPLTADEIEFLYAMREDEKLARDLYAYFWTRYPTAPQIQRISKAEESHIAAIETVLDYYEISYPAMSAPGVFEDSTRQALYDELALKSETMLEAFQTMAFVEDRDLFAYKMVQSQITNANLSLLIENMIKASTNHLKAAIRQIFVRDGSYTSIYLSAEEYDAIIKLPFQNGKAYKTKKGKNGNGNGGDTNAQKMGQNNGRKGEVNGAGICTATSNGTSPGSAPKGSVGKKYRGGKG